MIDEHVAAREQYYPVNELEELGAWLAARMPALCTLSLFVSYCPQLPALPMLTHLELQALKFDRVNAALQHMPALRTLLLACKHMEALLPELNLLALPNLTHLSFHDVYPELLMIPSSCRLDLHGEAETIQQVGKFSRPSSWEACVHTDQSLRQHTRCLPLCDGSTRLHCQSHPEQGHQAVMPRLKIR